MNSKLTGPIVDNDIEAALFQMGPMKSPGPDGLAAMFYLRHWSLVKNDVCTIVRDFLLGAATPETFNSIVIVMIPKVDSLELMS